ncbi:inactive rhomboid protein 1-like [Saccostrea echinata]|uniref:inactive rhomboid protein 1-like n=1 Tax=Saccostrea echinata TaxID=191078 RepID=UPI002A81CF34|nr:inactive rhomboid protein 1-like [Saccostrea echinata]
MFNNAKRSLFEFLGLPTEAELPVEDKEELKQRWQARRKKTLLISPGMRQVDELDYSSATWSTTRRKPHKKPKKPVARLLLDFSASAMGLSKERRTLTEGEPPRSFAPAALDKFFKPVFDERWRDEKFFDDKEEPLPSRPEVMAESNDEEVDSGMGKREKGVMGADSGDIELTEVTTFGMSRMSQDVVDAAPVLKVLEEDFCSLISCRCSEKNSVIGDDEDDYMNRPYFTYFITFVQTVILICALAIYGIGPFGVDEVVVQDVVLKPNLALEAEARREFGNMWLGPSQKDLIHLGAKYSPCMRKDPNLEAALAEQRKEERNTGCCVRDDGSGCVQTTIHKCSKLISTFVKWNDTSKIDNGYKSGAVCGLDPNHCKSPSSTPPFEWDKKDFTNWPVCKETKNVSRSFKGCSQPGSDCHMTCDLLGRPCCFGIQGECMITTREHCEFRQGYFHDDKFLCSQVNCFEEICGMIPFVYDDRPDQFGRILSANLLHAGLFHLLVTWIFQLWIMRRIEQMIGWIRMMIIYVSSGCAGTLASAILTPYQVEVGPSGAQFGILACMYVDIVNQILVNKFSNEDKSSENRSLCFNLVAFSAILLVLFFLGVFPWMDNWSHIFGFIFGLFISLVVMKETDVKEKGITRVHVVITFGILSLALFLFLIIMFYAAPLTESTWLQYINCIPFSDTFCKNMDVTINRGSTYSKYVK